MEPEYESLLKAQRDDARQKAAEYRRVLVNMLHALELTKLSQPNPWNDEWEKRIRDVLGLGPADAVPETVKGRLGEII